MHAERCILYYLNVFFWLEKLSATLCPTRTWLFGYCYSMLCLEGMVDTVGKNASPIFFLNPEVGKNRISKMKCR